MDIGSEGYFDARAKKAKQPKGDVRRVLAIVDKKSSRKDHQNTNNPLQLLFYEEAMKEIYPQLGCGVS